ncbi:TetR/AcrR family transcriptional regulator [Lichenifustis flavocetrariae]|uniref:TetR/AcrR family transcriptional regulator n=1 Tax=Lichenifustis flavocetrariae TaxID=2949735 RepID=A0AA42CKT0_9HYPH|nr:TetR/AcrR family transcriptional regulator [Lichenifustis flavocetrariae]MCW6510894.1 TetR/AcrR family transcriptional regulator [Lichenifustis flavocetrariae]
MVDATLLSPAEAAERDDGGKRRQIIEGARRVFHHSGFDAASMNEIARTAAVSKGTLYVYFDSKEALFEALIRQDKREQAEQTCRFDEAEAEADLRSALIMVGTRLISLILEPARVAQLRTIIAVSAKFPRIGQAYYEAGPKYGMERLAEFLRSRADDLQIVDYQKAAYHLAELCKSRHLLQAILCVGQQLSREDILDHVSEAVDVFLRAYKVR